MQLILKTLLVKGLKLQELAAQGLLYSSKSKENTPRGEEGMRTETRRLTSNLSCSLHSHSSPYYLLLLPPSSFCPSSHYSDQTQWGPKGQASCLKPCLMGCQTEKYMLRTRGQLSQKLRADAQGGSKAKYRRGSSGAHWCLGVYSLRQKHSWKRTVLRVIQAEKPEGLPQKLPSNVSWHHRKRDCSSTSPPAWRWNS